MNATVPMLHISAGCPVTRLILSSGFSLPQFEDKLLLQTNQYLCGEPHVNRVDFKQTTKPTIAHEGHPWEPPNARMERNASWIYRYRKTRTS